MNSLRNLAVIQVRSGSSRLPNKCFANLGKYRLIDWVIKRVKKTKLIDKIVLATTTNKKDFIFKSVAKKHNVEYFFGDEKNVLFRFYKVIEKFKPKNVLRICADNPFISSCFLNDLIKFYKKNKCHLAFNHTPKVLMNYNCIDGFGAEIFEPKIILNALKKTKNKMNLEHVTRFFYLNKKFLVKPVPLKKMFYAKTKSLEINTIEDLKYLQKLVKKHNIKINSSAELIVSKLKKKNL